MEMAIVLAIMGAIAGSALTLGAAKHEASKIDVTVKRLDAIEAAIKLHAFAAGFLPCPADPTALPGTAEYGVSADCGATPPAGIAAVNAGTPDEIWIGAIPTRTLNLPDSTMYDGWQNRFSFVVVTELALSASNFQGFSTGSTTGVIQILDNDGTQITDANADTVVAYAIISHGKNKKGGIPRAGNMPLPCGTPGVDELDADNCDNADAVFRDSRIADSTTPANYYDDIIRWKTKNFLAPLSGEAGLNNATCVATLVGRNTLSCALDGNGKPWCWGNNTDGEFGDGNTGTNSPTPAAAHGGSDDKGFDASSADNFTCGLTLSDEIWCSGKNDVGQLGNNDAPNDSAVPVQEALGATNWSKLATAQTHACAINSIGETYCWGNNAAGKLGVGDTAQRNQPTLVVGGFTDWSSLGLTHHSSCGLRSSGIAYCWGSNGSGQLGDGGASGASSNVPVAVSGGYADWTMLSGTALHVCGLRATGQAYCWGSGSNGRLGNGSTSASDVPLELANNYTDWSYIAAGYRASCGIRTGHLYCWGNSNDYGVPDATNGSAGNVLIPSEAAGGYSDWAMVSPPGQKGGCAARGNGKLYCWGLNDVGQVGDGTSGTPRPTPTLVSGINGCQ